MQEYNIIKAQEKQCKNVCVYTGNYRSSLVESSNKTDEVQISSRPLRWERPEYKWTEEKTQFILVY